MKHPYLKIGLPFLLAAVAVVFFTSKKRPPEQSEPDNAIYQFEYYPKANVYFNKNRAEYAVQLGDGSWEVVKSLPDTVELNEKHVKLTSTRPVWINNDKHRLVYATSLYAEASDLQEPEPEPVTTSLEVELTDDSLTIEEEPKEKGVKKFFKKLFGKKENRE